MKPTNTINSNWANELNATILRYHIIALWVAVIFNLLFFVSDYINVYSYWKEFLSVRIFVSLICLITVLSHKKLKISRELLGVIPVLLISIQNAYMWSVMDVEHLQKHTLSYMALFIGSGMFVFYRVYYSIFIVVANIVANIIFFYINNTLTVDEIMVSGGLLTASVAVFSILLIRMRYNLTKKELIGRFALEDSKLEVEKKNKKIVDSINYAKRIQNALIPPVDVFKKALPNSFVFYKPKDIVSGDFYWIAELNTTKADTKENEKLVVFSAADCTGHGVPGAFMSLIGIKIFNQSISQKKVNTPAEALDYLNNEVFNTINKHSENDNIIKDGMDVALCAINRETLKLSYSGAKNPVYIVRNKTLHEIKGDRQPIGYYSSQKSFTNHEYQLQKNDMIFIFTDGFPDQFGGPDKKKFMYKPFKNLLIEHSDKDLEVQHNELELALNTWKGDQEQLDDICIIGVRV